MGVYPPYGGREPSFPNPTANLVSTKKERILPFKGEVLFHAREIDFLLWKDGSFCLLCCFVESSIFLLLQKISPYRKEG